MGDDMTESTPTILRIPSYWGQRPFQDDSPGAALWYEMLGRFVSLWASFEQRFDLITGHLLGLLHENGTSERKPPALWPERKVLWTRAVQLDSLYPIRYAVLDVLERAVQVADERNIVVHT